MTESTELLALRDLLQLIDAKQYLTPEQQGAVRRARELVEAADLVLVPMDWSTR